MSDIKQQVKDYVEAAVSTAREVVQAVAAKIDEDPKQAELVANALGTSVVASSMLLRARSARKSGDYTKAIYYAVLWSGFTRNANQALYRKIDEQRR